jgi:branched-chain amino acid transport system permease protein
MEQRMTTTASSSFLKDRWPWLVLIGVVMIYPILTSQSYAIARLGVILVLYSIVLAGAILLIPYAGIVSMGQGAFFGMGAYISAILTVRLGVSPWLAMVIAAGGTTLAAYLFCAPFLKLRAIYLAIATLGLGEIVTLVIRDWHEVTGGVSGLSGIPYFHIGSVTLKHDWQIFYLCGGVLVIFAFLADNVGKTRLGRAYHAIRTNEVAAQASGINVQKNMRDVFCFSAFVASVAGSLLAHFTTFVSPDIFASLSFTFLIIVFVGGANVWGGLATGIMLLGLSEVFRSFQNLSMGLYGLLLIVAFFVFPDGLSAVVFKGSNAAKRMSVTHRRRTDLAVAETPADKGETNHREGKILELSGVSMMYGGTAALSKVSFDVGYRQIVGIIGPNGAGKTTLLNVINGYLTPVEGKITLKNVDVTYRAPHEMARLGVGRTFQLINLFKGMTVIENVMVGGHLKGKAGIFESGLTIGRARREETTIWNGAVRSLQIVGLMDRAYDIVDSLSFGEQRLVELARALTLGPDLLFVDEPAAGLNTAEATKLGETLRRIRDEGVTIIVVEHNMSLVMSISDMVCVLDFGKLIATGTPDYVCSHEEVIKAYLGPQETKKSL